uniref:Autophagy-related protein 27 n=1 Tax=Psilocybe cubensis TaxID=181762 RepID=A0A8H7Y9Y3_PSICU
MTPSRKQTLPPLFDVVTVTSFWGKDAAIKINTTISLLDSKPRLVISGGSKCKSGDIRASTVIQFVCDVSLGNSGPRFSAQLPPGDDEDACAYFIEWKTPYACPTSEGSGFWGFITFLAVVFLVVLLAYAILGTLYNRYVLQLRGFDQIPQFSIESMKYHGSEAWDWAKDMFAALNITGGHTPGGGNMYGRHPSSAGRTPNPVSHQAQVSGFGGDHAEEEGLPFNGGGGGFVRPQVGKNRSTSFTKPETNPISHQSQVLEAQSLSYSSPSPLTSQSPPQVSVNNTIPQNQNRRTILETRGPTKEELDFMLGEDDEEEDAQELVDVKSPPVHTTEESASTSPRNPPSGTSPPANVSSSTSPEPESAAAARGRDLGGGDTIRL